MEHCLVTGSYDETIRVYDTRQMRRPIAQASVGGGVWRLKWSPTRKNILAAACMHAGFAVLKYDHDSGSFAETLPFVGEHKSLGYGIDWQFPESGLPAVAEDGEIGDAETISSASFYDHLMQFWSA